MNFMMEEDQAEFNREFQAAIRFQTAAHLRWQHWCKLMQKKAGHLNEYGTKRLAELSACPAVMESEWYQDKLKRNGLT